MYLISLYFDDVTNQKLNELKMQVYKKTGNDSMLKIPNHITLASFQCEEEKVLDIFSKIDVSSIDVEFVSIGFFLPSVLFVQPILSRELESIMNIVHSFDISSSNRYQPYHWICHVTISKYLKNEELSIALQSVQNEFKPFAGKVKKIGLAKSNPYTDICIKVL